MLCVCVFRLIVPCPSLWCPLGVREECWGERGAKGGYDAILSVLVWQEAPASNKDAAEQQGPQGAEIPRYQRVGSAQKQEVNNMAKKWAVKFEDGEIPNLNPDSNSHPKPKPKA